MFGFDVGWHDGNRPISEGLLVGDNFVKAVCASEGEEVGLDDGRLVRLCDGFIVGSKVRGIYGHISVGESEEGVLGCSEDRCPVGVVSAVGRKDGSRDGPVVGRSTGLLVGTITGGEEGSDDGHPVETCDGSIFGIKVGSRDGIAVASTDGKSVAVGESDGGYDGSDDGDSVGIDNGSIVGLTVGNTETADSKNVGCNVGSIEERKEGSDNGGSDETSDGCVVGLKEEKGSVVRDSEGVSNSVELDGSAVGLKVGNSVDLLVEPDIEDSNDGIYVVVI